MVSSRMYDQLLFSSIKIKLYGLSILATSLSRDCKEYIDECGVSYARGIK